MEQRDFTATSFNKFLGEKKLMGSKCQKCGAVYLPPRPLCLNCHDTQMEWVEFSGKGELAAFTAVAVAPTFMLAQGLGKNNPYVSGVVRLTEGPGISARILGVDAKKPETIGVGTPVQLEILERAEGEARVYSLAFKA